MDFTGRDILDLGVKAGPHIPAMIKRVNDLGRLDINDLTDLMPEPQLELQEPKFTLFATATNDDEEANLSAVRDTLREVSRTPVVVATVGMPDACPAGPLGTIPVGGVVASTMIHPGMHSADICCSVTMSIVDIEPKEALDTVHTHTHFGPGGRNDLPMPDDLRKLVESNPYTKPLVDMADHHFGTQGDGNHFAYVGKRRSDSRTALVTHHGSRGFGARLYKVGMSIAQRHTSKVSPDTLKQNSWIDPTTQEGQDYWEALQIIREWTKQNHIAIHECLGDPDERFWNEHNFVFKKEDGLFYHAKGATPAFDDWADDATELTLIPLNMAEPILITRGLDKKDALGFAPHGAGRNFSRSEHSRRGLGNFEEETKHIDARFFSGITDPSELPSGYKNADEVVRQINQFGLTNIVDYVDPYGSIMAGDWQRDAPWRKK